MSLDLAINIWIMGIHMTTDEIIQRLSATNRAEVARATGIPYMWLSNVVWGDIKSPSSRRIDILRAYFERATTAVRTQ